MCKSVTYSIVSLHYYRVIFCLATNSLCRGNQTFVDFFENRTLEKILYTYKIENKAVWNQNTLLMIFFDYSVLNYIEFLSCLTTRWSKYARIWPVIKLMLCDIPVEIYNESSYHIWRGEIETTRIIFVLVNLRHKSLFYFMIYWSICFLNILQIYTYNMHSVDFELFICIVEYFELFIANASVLYIIKYILIWVISISIKINIVNMSSGKKANFLRKARRVL